jgi:hypothetical protein
VLVFGGVMILRLYDGMADAAPDSADPFGQWILCYTTFPHAGRQVAMSWDEIARRTDKPANDEERIVVYP